MPIEPEQKHKLPERIIFRPGEMTNEIETRLEELGKGFGAYVRNLIRIDTASTRIEPVQLIPIIRSVQLRIRKEVDIEGASYVGTQLAETVCELGNVIETLEGIR